MNIIEAVNQLGNEGKIKRKCWGDMYLKKNLKLYIKKGTYYQLYEKGYIFKLSDILANDWEVVE